MREAIEFSAQGIEALAVAIIVIAILHGSVRFLVGTTSKSENAYELYKNHLAGDCYSVWSFLWRRTWSEPWCWNPRCRTS
jgi:hypothetical protein